MFDFFLILCVLYLNKVCLENVDYSQLLSNHYPIMFVIWVVFLASRLHLLKCRWRYKLVCCATCVNLLFALFTIQIGVTRTCIVLLNCIRN